MSGAGLELDEGRTARRGLLGSKGRTAWRGHVGAGMRHVKGLGQHLCALKGDTDVAALGVAHGVKLDSHTSVAQRPVVLQPNGKTITGQSITGQSTTNADHAHTRTSRHSKNKNRSVESGKRSGHAEARK